jgi:hypothetical protein
LLPLPRSARMLLALIGADSLQLRNFSPRSERYIPPNISLARG